MKNRSWLASALVALPIFLLAGSASALETIYLVRHADKETAWPKTKELNAFQPLTCTGSARAEQLAKQLGEVKIAAIYTSTTTRTLATGLPLAKATGVPISPDDRTIKTKNKIAKFFKDMKARHAADSAILVVGHSNTVPELLIELGAETSCYPALDIADHDGELLIHGYEGLWRVDLSRPGCAGIERQEVRLEESTPTTAPKAHGTHH